MEGEKCIGAELEKIAASCSLLRLGDWEVHRVYNIILATGVDVYCFHNKGWENSTLYHLKWVSLKYLDGYQIFPLFRIFFKSYLSDHLTRKSSYTVSATGLLPKQLLVFTEQSPVHQFPVLEYKVLMLEIQTLSESARTIGFRTKD